jgi:hypothetical protein
MRPKPLLVPDRRLLAPKAVIGGRISGKIIREDRVIDEFACENIVVNQGLNYLLGAALGAQSVVTSWFIGLFNNNYTILASDTAATISNSAIPASFTFNASLTVYGAFMISSSAINGTSGTLFSGAQFGSAKAVVNTDILQLTYTFTAASA